MTRPAKRIPRWLTIDVPVIIISLAIIGVGIGIGIAPDHEPETPSASNRPATTILAITPRAGRNARPYPRKFSSMRS